MKIGGFVRTEATESGRLIATGAKEKRHAGIDATHAPCRHGRWRQSPPAPIPPRPLRRRPTNKHPVFCRYKLGAYQLTALYDGIWYLPIDDKFVRNAGGRGCERSVRRGLPAAERAADLVHRAAREHRRQTGADRHRNRRADYTTAAGFMNANLAAAGIAPDAIDIIVISHFHPDHIDGIKTKDGDKRVFRNAEILVPEPEWEFWMDDGNIRPGERRGAPLFPQRAAHLQGHRQGGAAIRSQHEVAPGIVSVPAFGHTPGHTAFAIHSGGQSMLAISDTVLRTLVVRAPSRLAAELRHGRAAGGECHAGTCSTARSPTACWSRPITSRSRPAATSPRAAPATSMCRSSGSRTCDPKRSEAGASGPASLILQLVHFYALQDD